MNDPKSIDVEYDLACPYDFLSVLERIICVERSAIIGCGLVRFLFRYFLLIFQKSLLTQKIGASRGTFHKEHTCGKKKDYHQFLSDCHRFGRKGLNVFSSTINELKWKQDRVRRKCDKKFQSSFRETAHLCTRLLQFAKLAKQKRIVR